MKSFRKSLTGSNWTKGKEKEVSIMKSTSTGIAICSSKQKALHPSPGSVLPSSHCSPKTGSKIPLPHGAVGIGAMVDVGTNGRVPTVGEMDTVATAIVGETDVVDDIAGGDNVTGFVDDISADIMFDVLVFQNVTIAGVWNTSQCHC